MTLHIVVKGHVILLTFVKVNVSYGAFCREIILVNMNYHNAAIGNWLNIYIQCCNKYFQLFCLGKCD